MDIDSIRKNTPGVEHVVHFNSAGASLVSQYVLQIQLDYLNEEAKHGGYETAALYAEQLEGFYKEASDLINASPDEIAFTESATVAWQRAFFSIPFNAGDKILTCKVSYASNYIAYLYLKQEKGIVVEVVPSNDKGEVDLAQLEKRIDAKTRLISITHIPTNGGLVNPAEAIGSIAKKHDVLYLLDACQSIGQYPVDVEKTACDFLSATGRKYLRGPRGTGFLYVKSSVAEKLTPFNLDLHGAEIISSDAIKVRKGARKFETWEGNLAGKLGLTAAIQEANMLGIKNIWHRIVELAAYLREELSKINTVTVRDLGRQKCGIVTFTSAIPANQLKEALTARGYNTTVTSRSGTFLDMSDRNIDEMLRVSVHYFNTDKEVDDLVKLVAGLLK